MERVMASIWGVQTAVSLGSWEAIKALGFKKRDRAFGQLNDGTAALCFCRCNKDTGKDEWYFTVEKLEDIS